MNPLDALSGEVDELVSSFTSTPIVGNLDTFGFTQYSFWFAVAVVLMLVLLFAFKKKQSEPRAAGPLRERHGVPGRVRA